MGAGQDVEIWRFLYLNAIPRPVEIVKNASYIHTAKKLLMFFSLYFISIYKLY